MRRIESFGSVKAISLDRDEILRRLREASAAALEEFPDLLEVRLIGSLAAGTHTGTSDVDLLLRLRKLAGNPLETVRPYYLFFSRRLDIGLDVVATGPSLAEGMDAVLQDSVVLASRAD